MGFIIFLTITFYLLFGAMLGGIIDDNSNNSITDGILKKNLGVPLCILFWPLLIALFLIITILNSMYLLGKKIKEKWWNK